MNSHKNETLEYLLKQNENILPHFLEIFSQRVINNQACVFVGSGVSTNSNYPNWSSLLAPCAEALGIDIKMEKDLYALAQFYVNKHKDSELRRYVSDKINSIPHSNELLDSLLDIDFKSIWTTNFDKLIENALLKRCVPHNIISNDKNLASIDTAEKINIYKMNGDISDPTNMILTKHDYEHYKTTHPLFLTFLRKELVANTFLFVGYSFNDSLILESLSAINEYLGEFSAPHYAIMVVDENTTMRFVHYVDDLEQRYNVKCIFSKKEDIVSLVHLLKRSIKRKKVFISGSYEYVSEKTNLLADAISRTMVTELYDSGYRISTGIGKKLGTLITGYANQYLAERNVKNPSKYLSMRPFPFHLELDEQTKLHYRKIMQRDCSIAIFMFGQSHTSAKLGCTEQNGHYSPGVYQEFEIAKKNNLIIIPIGATGYEAELIWREVKRNINKYYYLEKKIDVLLTENNPKKLISIIISILDEVSKNGNIY